MAGKFFNFETAWNTIIAIGFWGIRLISSTFIYLFISVMTDDGEFMGTIAAVSLCILAFMFAFVSIIVASKMNLIKANKISMSFFKWLIVFIVVGFFITKLGIQGIKLFSSGFNTTTYNQELINNLFENIPLYARVFVFGICSVVIEEIFYRGGIIGLIFKNYPKIGLLVSTVVFGLEHNPTNIISSIIYGSLGLIWGMAYLKFKRLELPVILHMINNIVSILFPNIFI